MSISMRRFTFKHILILLFLYIHGTTCQESALLEDGSPDTAPAGVVGAICYSSSKDTFLPMETKKCCSQTGYTCKQIKASKRVWCVMDTVSELEDFEHCCKTNGSTQAKTVKPSDPQMMNCNAPRRISKPRSSRWKR